MQAQPTITIHGNLTKDPVSKTVNGKTLFEYSVAVNTKKDEPPTYFEVTAFGDRGVPSFISKGSPVCVIGRYRFETYKKGDGSPGYAHRITQNELIALPSKRQDEGPATGGGSVGDDGANF